MPTLERIAAPRVGIHSPKPKKAWAAAQSLDDLCYLTERWLTRDLKSQPGYYGSVDVDQAPGLLDALLALNRAGLLTRNSQKGADGEGFNGRRFTQVAAVDGYASPEKLAWLRERLAGTPHKVEAFRPRLRSTWSVVPVTWVDGEEYTRFGGGLSRRGIAEELDGAGKPAVQEAQSALQFVLYDPEPARNRLWPDLLDRLS